MQDGKDELHEELSIRKKGHEIETYDLCTEFVMMIIHENGKRDELQKKLKSGSECL